MRAFIGYSRRNCELNFCTGSDLAPKVQSCSDSFSALAHTAQPPVFGDPAFGEHMGINSLAVVTNPNPKLLVIVSYLCLNPSRLRVAKSVSQDFERDSAKFVLDARCQSSPLAFFDQSNAGESRVSLLDCANSRLLATSISARFPFAIASERRP